ncbi:MAG: hypothetical protein E7175_01735 [Erysipelotrichaceae bacterium]|nr:hypothetical protein [Erysipelotrichaceae bacterium]
MSLINGSPRINGNSVRLVDEIVSIFKQDEEGLQNARIVARNMVFLMKAIKDAKEKYGLPEKEDIHYTHFIK